MILNYLKSMAIFASVVETGSFTLAGKRLGMPRGKVSEQVSRLEDYLGVRLLQRSTRKVTATEEGYALYKHSQTLLRHGVEGVEEVKNFAEEIKGKIRITATHDFFQYQLLPILKRFKQHYPNVHFDLQITEEAVAIIDDSIDLAIRSGSLPDSGLVSVPLTTTKLMIYASPELTHSLPQHPSQLENYEWASLSLGKSIEPLLLTNDKQQHSIQPNYQHFANSTSSYISLIEHNFAIGVMTELTGSMLVNKGRLVPLLPNWSCGTVPISLIYPARQHMAKRTRLLIDMIKSSINY